LNELNHLLLSMHEGLKSEDRKVVVKSWISKDTIDGKTIKLAANVFIKNIKKNSRSMKFQYTEAHHKLYHLHQI